MAITDENSNTWQQIGFRAPPELIEGINEYAEKIGAENNSAAVRLILAAGLDVKLKKTDYYTEKTIIENAKADAMHLLDQIISGAMEVFREVENLDPSQLDDDADEDDDGDEEGD